MSFLISKFNLSPKIYKLEFCIWVDFGSGSFYRKIISLKNLDRTLFDRKVRWPKAILTETLFDRPQFDRKIILPKGYLTEKSWIAGHLTESFSGKGSFDRKVF
jgi:hypothetical protein